MAGQILLEQLLNEQNLGEVQIRDEIESFVGRLVSRDDVSLEKDPELSSEKRLVFVHPESSTLAVGVVERFYPDSEVIKWLCVLPKLAAQRKLKLTRLFICGLKKPKDTDEVVAGGDGAEPEASAVDPTSGGDSDPGMPAEAPVKAVEIKVPIDKKLCVLEGVDNAAILEKLEAFVSSVIHPENPVMPRTMWAGLSGVMAKSRKGRKAKSQASAADLLGGGEFAQSDAKDQRARVFIPEKFDFVAFNDSIDRLLGCAEGSTTGWKYYSSREVNPYLKNIEKEIKAEAKRLKKANDEKEKESVAAKKKEDRELKKAESAARKALSGKAGGKKKSNDHANSGEPSE
jgi:hypothetical protein